MTLADLQNTWIVDGYTSHDAYTYRGPDGIPHIDFAPESLQNPAWWTSGMSAEGPKTVIHEAVHVWQKWTGRDYPGISKEEGDLLEDQAYLLENNPDLGGCNTHGWNGHN